MNGIQILGMSILSLCVLGVLCAAFAKSILFANMFSHVFHRTINEDFWEDTLDPDGTLVHITRSNRDESIVGMLHRIERHGDNRWIQLSEYKIMNKDNTITEKGSKFEEISIKIDHKDIVRYTYSSNSHYRHK